MLQQIFVSYTQSDNDQIAEILQAIKTHVDVKMVAIPFEDSESTEKRIAAILDSDAFLIVLSSNILDIPTIKDEWTTLLQMRHPIFICKLDDVEAQAIDERLHLIPWVDLASDNGLETLRNLLSDHWIDEDDEDSVIRVRPITGQIDRKLLNIPIYGREYGLDILQKHLKQAPTMILGVGGIGKSRVAAELVITSPDIAGAIWFSCVESSQASHLQQLVCVHFEQETTTTIETLQSVVHQTPTLIVIDDAEHITEDNRSAFIELINALFEVGAQVLITSREEWYDLDIYETYRPQRVGEKNSTKIILDMAQVFRIHRNLENKAPRLAKAARYHPGMMEWAVKQCRHLPPERIIAQLQRLQGKTLGKLLDEMVHSTIRRMTRREGKGPYNSLQFLVACRDGFTYEATETLLAVDDETRDVHLEVLVTWQFVRMTTIRGTTRYWVDPMVIDCIAPHPDAAARHYTYYRELAERQHADKSYRVLVPEIANLEKAGLHEPNFATWLQDIWDDIIQSKTKRKNK